MTAPVPTHRRNASATKARLLEAAMRAFSESGYSQSGIREIAELAGTSSTMLLRYFGSKAALFEAALTEAMPVASVLSHPRERFGASLAAALLDPRNAIRPPLMIALASGDPEAATIAARVMETQSIAPLAHWLGGENGRARALQIAMLATGLVSYLRQLPLPKLAVGQQDGIASWFAATVQAIVDGQ